MSSQLIRSIDGQPWFELWGWCYGAVWTAFNRKTSKLGRNPTITEILPDLDEGHAAFYQTFVQAKEAGELSIEDLDNVKVRWTQFFDIWTSWFQEHHPTYFLSTSELEARYHEASKKFWQDVEELLKNRGKADNNLG